MRSSLLGHTCECLLFASVLVTCFSIAWSGPNDSGWSVSPWDLKASIRYTSKNIQKPMYVSPHILQWTKSGSKTIKHRVTFMGWSSRISRRHDLRCHLCEDKPTIRSDIRWSKSNERMADITVFNGEFPSSFEAAVWIWSTNSFMRIW